MSQRESINITDVLAPWVVGRYSVQTVSEDPKGPALTVYRASGESALAWIRKSAADNRPFRYYMLRHAEDAWDVYDSKGRLHRLCSAVAQDKKGGGEHPGILEVDTGLLDAEASALIGNCLQTQAVLEGHAGAAMADHSNFIAVMRMLITMPPGDMEHVYMLESRLWECRVMGIFTRMQNMTERTTDLFLDLYARLRDRRPVDVPHFSQLMARRLAGVRADYTAGILRVAAEAESGIDTPGNIAAPCMFLARGDADRLKFTGELVDIVIGELARQEDGPAAEALTVEAVNGLAPRIMDAFRRTMAVP